MKIAYLGEYLKLLSKMNGLEMARLFGSVLNYFFTVLTRVRYCEKKINDYRMLLDLEDQGITRELMFHGTREKDHIICLKEELREGMTVLDIGANLGYYSIMLGKIVGKSGKVYAIEPSMHNFCMLRLNIALNKLGDVVETYNLGIANETGMGKFYESVKSNWHTFYPKVHSGTSSESLDKKDPINVPVTTVGDFLKGKRKADLLRMDVEGFEVEIFEGLTPFISNQGYFPKILFEVHQPRYDDNEHNMRSRLRDLFNEGYYTKFLASNNYEETTRNFFRRKGYEPDAVVRTDGRNRGIFHDIENKDAVELICDTDFVRSVLLKCEH